jgi:hypothetical protein
MPLLRYFVCVGAALLALLFVAGAVLPQEPLPAVLASAPERPAVRIHSDRKWPSAVVFDTSAPPPVTVASVPSSAEAPAPSPASLPKSSARDAYAQIAPAQSAANASPATDVKKPAVKRHVARTRPQRPPGILVAQQPRYGFFDTW